MSVRGLAVRWDGVLRVATGVAAGLLCTFLASCSSGAVPPLRVGVPPWLCGEFANVARDLGFFDDRDVALVHYGSPIELARHFREGSLDVALLTLDYIPYMSAATPSLDVVFVVDVSSGGDGIVATPPAGAVSELRGRRIGYEATPLGVHMLLRALQSGGLRARDVEAIPVDYEEHASAFLGGRVDAVVTREPERSRLVGDGASSMFDSSQVPGQVVDVLVVPSATASSRGEDLRKLVDGWLSAYAGLQDNHAAMVARLASGLGVPATTVEKSLAGLRLTDLQGNRELLGGQPPHLAATLEEIRRFAGDADLLPESQARAVRFTDAYLPRVVTRPAGRFTGASWQ
jgi:NitT/TauT family transport system substrate-binding protein